MPRKIKKYEPDEKRPKGRRADGRLSTKVTIGKDMDGKPIVKYAYGYTKTELQNAMNEIKKTYITGNVSVERDILFGVYAIRWYQAYIEPRKISDSAKEDYSNSLNNHIFPVFAERQIRAIMPMDIQEFLNSKARQGLSKSLVTKLYRTLKCVFSVACGQFVIDRDPMTTIRMPDAKAGQKRALTETERKAALYVGENHPEGLVIFVLYYTGMRIGEVLGLQWQDIDFKKKEISVCRDIDFHSHKIVDGKVDHVDTLKSEAAYRTIPIPPPLLAALNKAKGIGTAFVFQGDRSGSYLSLSSFQRLWRRLMIAMHEQEPTIECRPAKRKGKDRRKPGYKGKPGPKPQQAEGPLESMLTPHYFRHNFATLLYDADVDLLTAIQIFGHKDTKLLLDIYTDLSEKKRKESVARLDHIFS